MLSNLRSAALKRAVRDWRLREIRILFLALTVAVVSVTSISFFTDRVERAMLLQGTALLGADLLILSSRPVSEKVRQVTSPYASADIVEFRSVILSGEDSLLTEVKAVAQNYPLRGALETSDTLGSVGSSTAIAPRPGEAWAAPGVFYQLGLSPGSNIQLGNSNFKLSRIITFEPDAGGSLLRFAPRLLINIDSLAETGLLTPGSRATYKQQISGEEKEMYALREPLKKVLGPSETLQTVSIGHHSVKPEVHRE